MAASSASSSSDSSEARHIDTAVKAAIKAVASDSLKEGESLELEKEKPEGELKMDLHPVVGTPPSYRRYESPRPPSTEAPAAGSSTASTPQPPPTQSLADRKGSTGILRVDGAFSSRRRSSGEPAVSPAPSTDRMSVTFAVDGDEGSQNNGSPGSGGSKKDPQQLEEGDDEIIRTSESRRSSPRPREIPEGERSPATLGDISAALRDSSEHLLQKMVSGSVDKGDEVEKETEEPVKSSNGLVATAAAGASLDLDDDEYTDSLLEIHR